MPGYRRYIALPVTRLSRASLQTLANIVKDGMADRAVFSISAVADNLAYRENTVDALLSHTLPRSINQCSLNVSQFTNGSTLTKFGRLSS